jgi:hypothetical protein
VIAAGRAEVAQHVGAGEGGDEALAGIIGAVAVRLDRETLGIRRLTGR